jgi:hypothetical protein
LCACKRENANESKKMYACKPTYHYEQQNCEKYLFGIFFAWKAKKTGNIPSVFLLSNQKNRTEEASSALVLSCWDTSYSVKV